MPELPEVQTVADALDSSLKGRTVRGAKYISRLRKPFDPEVIKKALAGKRCSAVRRRAKYLLFEFTGRDGLLAHLGMTGAFRIEKASLPYGRHDRVAIILDRGEELRFMDARRFGFVSLVVYPNGGGDPDELKHLGCEPLEREFSPHYIALRAKGRSAPVKTFIMDQSVVAGVGNIYASEALHLARVNPARSAGEVTSEEWKRIVQAIKKVLRQAVKAGGSTIRNYRTVDGTEGSFQLRLKVYGKAGEKCPRCRGAGIIETARMGGRSTFFCSTCQK